MANRTFRRGSFTALPAVLLLIFPAFSWSQEPDLPYRFRTQTEEVQVFLAALDQSGRAAALEAQDLLVLDNNREADIRDFQQRSDQRLTLDILVDVSSSAKKSLQWVRPALIDFLATAPQEGDSIRVRAFNRRLLSLGPDATAGLRQVSPAGLTALFDVLVESMRAADMAGGDRRAVVVISDGSDTYSLHTLAEAVQVAQSRGVPVYVLAVERDGYQDPGELGLRRLAAATGGDFRVVSRASDVARALLEATQELRQCYRLSYRLPEVAQPAEARTTKIVARGRKDLRLHYRRNYRVPEPAVPRSALVADTD